jgi:hypothetical protein
MTVTTEHHAPTGTTKRKNTRRGVKVLAVAGLLALVGGTAFAFWTQSGSGSGSASTGTTHAITITSDPISGLAPGVAPVGLTGSFNNPSDGAVRVHSISVAITSVTGGAGSCTADDYTFTPNFVLDVDAPAGSSTWQGGTIGFANSPTLNQDGCKGAIVHLGFTSD